jgi:DNA helicase TIP49 (TBP-interacting protein)
VTLIKLEEAIEEAAGQYFRLVILAGPPGSGKTAVLQAISQTLGCPVTQG